jgi:hypothetical protein
MVIDLSPPPGQIYGPIVAPQECPLPVFAQAFLAGFSRFKSSGRTAAVADLHASVALFLVEPPLKGGLA